MFTNYEDIDLLNSIPYPVDVNDNLDTDFVNVKNIINDISSGFMLKQQEERDKIIELNEINTIERDKVLNIINNNKQTKAKIDSLKSSSSLALIVIWTSIFLLITIILIYYIARDNINLFSRFHIIIIITIVGCLVYLLKERESLKFKIKRLEEL
tara:strand:- start:528 stop:992 length:465 start_codon:yes stop_codon:yes gene_type:complete